MKRLCLLIVVVLLSLSATNTKAAGPTNVMATRQWVLGVLSAAGINTNNFTNTIGALIVSSNRLVASGNWFTSTNYGSYNGFITSNAPGLFRLSITNNLGVDFLQRTNGVPIITATLSTNQGCNVGLFMVDSNHVDFYTRTGAVLVLPESIQFQVTK